MLNDYEVFAKKIIKKTKSHEIKWAACPWKKYEDFINDSFECVRMFESSQIDTRNLVVYEKKELVFNADLEMHIEQCLFHLMIVNDKICEKKFDESDISRDILSDILESAANDALGTEEFIENF